MELIVRAPLYVNPKARARTAVGKISLPMIPEPEKIPVPKNATSVPITSNTPADRAAAYAGISTAAASVYKRKAFRRPMWSATQPKLRYPGNIPHKFNTTISVVIPITPNPRPPCSTGSDKYGGSHVNNPHQANIPKKLNSKSANVRLTKGGRKIREKLAAFGSLSTVAAET